MFLLDVGQGHLFCGPYSLPLALEVSLCGLDRVGEMAVNHVDGEAGPGGIVARLDCVGECFFWGKTRGGVVPQECLFRAWQVEDGVDVIGFWVVLEREFPQTCSFASWGFQDGRVCGYDVGSCSIVNCGRSFLKYGYVV